MLGEIGRYLYSQSFTIGLVGLLTYLVFDQRAIERLRGKKYIIIILVVSFFLSVVLGVIKTILEQS